MQLETKAIHAGRGVDPFTGAVTTPFHPSTTFERSADGGYPSGYDQGCQPDAERLRNGDGRA